MKKIILLFLLNISLCNAQAYEFARDTISSTNDTLSVAVKNNLLASLYINIRAKDSIDTTIAFAEETIFKPQETIGNFIRIPRNILENDSASVSLKDFLTIKITYGNPATVRPDTTYNYLLPYKKKRKLIQGNFGNFSHNHEGSFHAYDFGTKVGDTIYAARNGKVILVKEDSKKHGRTREFSSFANFIIILHDDGTTAYYYHLDYNGVLTENGDIVERGQAIGISGMTGFTTTPHLHFVVRIPTKDRGNISIPIQFEGYESNELKQGKRYKRKH